MVFSNKTKENIFVVVNGKKLSGAEKRAIRFVYLSLLDGWSIELTINQAVYTKAKESLEFKPIISFIEEEKRLSLIPDKRLLCLFPIRFSYFIRFFILALIKRNEVAAFHTFLDHYPALIFAKIFKKKCLIELTGPNDVPQLLGIPNNILQVVSIEDYKVSVLRRLFLADGNVEILCISDSVRKRLGEYLSQCWPKAKHKEIYVYPLTLFHPKTPVISGSLDKENLIVYGSYFGFRKNPVIAAAGIAMFLALNKIWKVAFLGGGPLMDEVRAVFEEHDVEGQVEAIGRVPDLTPFLMRSKIYVSTIIPDNYPSQSILEAMYLNNALICNESGETYRFLENGKNGIFVELNAESIRKGIQKAASNQVSLSNMGQKSRAIVDFDFNQENYLAFIKDIYASINIK